MGLACVDGTFEDVAAVTSGGAQVGMWLPNVSDVLEIFLARFVVKDLVVDDVAASLEAGHDAGVGRYAVAVFLYL